MGKIITETSRLTAYDLANDYADNALIDVDALIDWDDSNGEEVEILRDGTTSAQWDEILAAADVARVLVPVLGELTGTPWMGREVPTDDQLLADDRRVVGLRDLLQEIKDDLEVEESRQGRVFVAEGEWVEYIEQDYKELAPEPIRESDWRPFEFIDWEAVAEDEDYTTITIDGDEYRYRSN
jgi:hypothetical protein